MSLGLSSKEYKLFVYILVKIFTNAPPGIWTRSNGSKGHYVYQLHQGSNGSLYEPDVVKHRSHDKKR